MTAAASALAQIQTASAPASSAAAPAAPAANAPTSAAVMAGWQQASAQAALSAPANHQVTLNVHTDALGTVQLHATMQNNVLGATLAVDRPEVHHWLSAQLPALEQTLAARQVQVGSLQLQAQTAGGGGGSASRQSPQPQPSTPRFFFPQQSGGAAATDAAAAEIVPAVSGGARLNLRA